MFGFGLSEALILGVVILLLFGRRLPGLFRSFGASLPAFRQGLQQDQASPQQRTLEAPARVDSM